MYCQVDSSFHGQLKILLSVDELGIGQPHTQCHNGSQITLVKSAAVYKEGHLYPNPNSAILFERY